MPGLPEAARARFEAVPDTVASRKADLVDCPVSSLAKFSRECSSHLQFEVGMRQGGEPAKARNLRSFFLTVFSQLQRSKTLEASAVSGGHYPFSFDAP